jgi:hypothetical protein
MNNSQLIAYNEEIPINMWREIFREAQVNCADDVYRQTFLRLKRPDIFLVVYLSYIIHEILNMSPIIK